MVCILAAMTRQNITYIKLKVKFTLARNVYINISVRSESKEEKVSFVYHHLKAMA